MRTRHGCFKPIPDSPQWTASLCRARVPLGKWVKTPPMALGVFSDRFTLGPVTAADADRYQLAQMQIAAPLATRTGKDDVASARQFVAPNDASMSAAVQA